VGTALRRLLCSKRCALTRTLETDTAGRTPANSIAVNVSNRYQRVIKRSLYVYDASHNILSDFSLCALCHNSNNPKKNSSTRKIREQKYLTFLFYTLLAGHCLPGPLTRPGIALCALAPNRKTSSMADSTITGYITQSSNILCHLPAKLTSNDIITVYYLRYTAQLILSELVCPDSLVDSGLLENLFRRMFADAKDIRQ
jgi:hypothetical protein